MEDSEIKVTFPCKWSNSDGFHSPPVDDPGMIYVLELEDEFSDYRIIKKTTLNDLIEEVIDLWINPVTKKIDDPEGIHIVGEMAAMLRIQAQRLQDAVTPEKKDE